MSEPPAGREARAAAVRPTPLWLSHHPPEEADRCTSLGRWSVCTRCLATYPVLFSAFFAQGALRAPKAWLVDPFLLWLLPLPALGDWARARREPRSGSPAIRWLTGALLGLSLGRSLYLHARWPGEPRALLQFALISVVVVGVLWSKRRGRKDPPERSNV